jgi:hypothetical protein
VSRRQIDDQLLDFDLGERGELGGDHLDVPVHQKRRLRVEIVNIVEVRAPFLSGMFYAGEVVYAGSEAEAAHDREPVAIFTGNNTVGIRYSSGVWPGTGASG